MKKLFIYFLLVNFNTSKIFSDRLSDRNQERFEQYMYELDQQRAHEQKEKEKIRAETIDQINASFQLQRNIVLGSAIFCMGIVVGVASKTGRFLDKQFFNYVKSK